MSPHTGLLASTVFAGGGNSPTLRGFRKWSMRRSLYICVSMVARLRASYHSGAHAAPIQIMNVVAAIIERNGRVLICQRKAGQRFAGKWEFPGGKVEAEEEFTAALARELREELAISA